MTRTNRQCGHSEEQRGLARLWSSAILLALVWGVSSCGGDPISPSLYEGNWALALVGATSGTATIEVFSTGTTPGGTQTELRFSNSIDMAGKVSGSFLMQGTVTNAGTLEATFFCFLVPCGSLNGSLAGNPGTGTFSLTGTEGTWTAAKQ